MSYHFVGLGGIGMSALARILVQRGERVRGSDVKASTLLDALRTEGIEAHVGHDATRILEGDVVVYSSGIDEDNPELKRARELRTPLLHRSELLHRLIGSQKALLVTGSHGKTTTSALLASVLTGAALDPSFAVGGLLLECNSNGRTGQGPYFVAEADESDGSFLKTEAFGAIVTNLSPEHLNFWHTQERLAAAFSQFFQNVQNKTHLFWCGDNENLRALSPPGFSYGFSTECDLCIERFQQDSEGILFDLCDRRIVRTYQSIHIPLFGAHNALNGAAVFALSLSLGINESITRTALSAFRGTHRRLERVAKIQNIELYDDYGHHPTEIATTLSGLRAKVRERRIVALFQPHRYSRLAHLLTPFTHCFGEVDELLITDVYSAGEPPGLVTALDLVEQIRLLKKKPVHFIPQQDLVSECVQRLRVGDVFITIGAGDIFKVGQALPPLLKNKRLRVGVLFGGPSPEHDISLISARNFLTTLDPELYDTFPFFIQKDGTWVSPESSSTKLPPHALCQCDVCIPVFHGPRGEDGAISALLTLLDLPFVGCDHASSALCMQKAWTKQIAIHHRVRTAPFVEYTRTRWHANPSALASLVTQRLTYPVWVKAVHLGSSIGVTRVVKEEDLSDAVECAFTHDDVLIIEEEVIGREIECAVLGNDVLRIGAPGEILASGQFYDYERKYGAQASPVQTPALLTPAEKEEVKEMALTMYEACGCSGLARVDFFLDSSGSFWLNEINPMPGFTANSLYPKMWEAAGLTQKELLNELIILALHRHRSRR